MFAVVKIDQNKKKKKRKKIKVTTKIGKNYKAPQKMEKPQRIE